MPLLISPHVLHLIGVGVETAVENNKINNEYAQALLILLHEI